MQQVRTAAAPAAIGPYSQAMAEGQLLFTSGQIPIDPATGELRNSDIATATRQVLSNLRAVLVAGGAGMNTVVKTTVFLKDMRDFQAFNGVYAEFFQNACSDYQSEFEQMTKLSKSLADDTMQVIQTRVEETAHEARQSN